MTALIAASEDGNILAMEKLLEGGVNVNLINQVCHLYLVMFFFKFTYVQALFRTWHVSRINFVTKELLPLS